MGSGAGVKSGPRGRAGSGGEWNEGIVAFLLLLSHRIGSGTRQEGGLNVCFLSLVFPTSVSQSVTV